MKQSLLLRAFLPAITLLSLSVRCLAGPADELIKKGDAHDVRFEAKEALACYLPAEKLEPSNVPLLLRIARQYRHEMADATSVSEKSRLGGIGKQYAERAVALAPNEAEAHLSVAICYGKSLALMGSKEKMQSLRVVRIFVDRSLALDANQDIAWYILGCWHQRVSELSMLKRKMAEMAYGGLPDASNEASVQCFQKAIALNPKRLIHYIELGRTYAQMGNEAEARKYIGKGLAMPNTGKDDPEAKVRGQETLSSL